MKALIVIGGTLGIMFISIFLLSMGSLFFGKKIKGSCGGIGKDAEKGCSCTPSEKDLCSANEKRDDAEFSSIREKVEKVLERK